MSSSVHAGPCSHCKAPNPSVRKKKGVAGRVTRTPWYRETVSCPQCHIEVTAGTPGNAILMWNRAFEARKRDDALNLL